jgi:hypothetical protein
MSGLAALQVGNVGHLAKIPAGGAGGPALLVT